MAQILQYVDLNLNRQTLAAAKIYPLPSASRTALVLTAADAGLTVYDTTLNSLQVWNGSNWQPANSSTSGGMAFKGAVAANSSAPSNPAAGDFYVFNSAGVTSWTPSATVAVGDAVVYDGSGWNYLERNAVSANTSAEGTVRLATQAEADAGALNTVAITPSSLATLTPLASANFRLTRRYRAVVNLTANTALTVSHGLGLNTAAECDINTYQSGNAVTVGATVVDANSISLISHVTLSNVTVVVIG